MSEVEKHNKPGDLWVVIEGKVWDMTEVGHNVTISAFLTGQVMTRPPITLSLSRITPEAKLPSSDTQGKTLRRSLRPFIHRGR
jgi:hypothetical protein